MDMTNEQYYDLIRPYEDARRLLETRLEILNHSLYGSRAVCGPIHNMQSRIKAKKSIEDKLKRLGQRDGVTNARDYLQDIAGIRVICYFVDDIYNVAAGLKRQSDLVLVKERDYIATPKPNATAAIISCWERLYTAWMPWNIFPWRSSSGPCPWISGPAWSTGSVIKRTRSTGNGWSRNF